MCVCPVGVRGWLVITFKSLSLLSAGGAFRRMKPGTLNGLQVKSYLSASTTGNIIIICMTWVFLYQTLIVGCWSLAGALDAISLKITEFRVGNHCCCELGTWTLHCSSAAAQPSSSRGPCNLTDGEHLIAWWRGLGPYPVGLSLTDVWWLTACWPLRGANKGVTI